MTRNYTDSETLAQIGSVMRATRKHLGLSQATVASHLGFTQCQLSKIESGQKMVDAIEWLHFCQLTGISTGALSSNQIELGQFESGIKLPARYSHDKGLTVRYCQSMLYFAGKTLGQEALTEFLREKKIDPDYFTDLNARINFNFPLDLMEALVQRAGVTPRDFEQVLKGVSSPKNHGTLQHHYNHLSTDQFALVRSLVNNFLSYTSNFKYEILNETGNELHISATPAPHMEMFHFYNHPVLGDFTADGFESFLRNFTAYGKQKPLNVETLEKHHGRGARDIYRISIPQWNV